MKLGILFVVSINIFLLMYGAEAFKDIAEVEAFVKQMEEGKSNFKIGFLD